MVHRVRHLGPLDHGADRDPLGVFERHYRGRASAWRDGRRGGENRATHVVLAHDILTRSDDARDARSDLIDERRDVRVFRRRGLYQHRLGLQQSRDWPEASRAHRFAGLCARDLCIGRVWGGWGGMVYAPTRSTAREIKWVGGDTTYMRWRATRTDAICEAERARGLDAASYILDLRASSVVLEADALVDVREEAAGEDLEARDDALSRERLDGLHGPCIGHLYLQRTLAKAETQRLRDVRLHLRLEDHVVTRDAEVDVALADERGDVGRR